MRNCHHHYDFRRGRYVCRYCGHSSFPKHRVKRIIRRVSIIVGIVIIGFFVYQNMGLIIDNVNPIEKMLVKQIPNFNTIPTQIPIPQTTITNPVITGSTTSNPKIHSCPKGFILLEGSCSIAEPSSAPTCPEGFVLKNASYGYSCEASPQSNPEIEQSSPQQTMPQVTTPQQTIQQVTTPEQTSQADSTQAINYINTKRVSDGKNSITYDTRVFNLAIARAKDMYDYGYLDHTNPQTGTCPYTMKSQFGLSASEDVAENAYEIGYEGTKSLFNPSLTDVIDSWMGSTGHRINLLFYGHTAGAVACYGNYCVFEGLNQNQFGHGCSTAKEGQAYASRFVNCTPDQMHQFDALNQQYDALSKQYDSFPRTATSDAEYQRDIQMYNQLQGLYNQINNFKC